MTGRLFAMSLLVLAIAACDHRVPPTMSNPTGQASMATSECPAGSPGCADDLAWWEYTFPWNWFG